MASMYDSMLKNSKRGKAFYVFVCFLAVFLLVALRHPSMGADLGFGKTTGYLGSFTSISNHSWKELFAMEGYLNYEIGFVVLNKLLGYISTDHQFFIAVCAFLCTAPVFYTIYKKSETPTLPMLIFLGLPMFLLMYSGLRQAIALALCFVATMYVQEKKLVKFVLVIAVASLFHSSALFFLIAYPLYYIRFGSTVRMISVILIPIAFLVRKPMYTILTAIFGYETVMDNNGAVTLFLLLTALYIVCAAFETSETSGLLNIYFVACVLQSMGGVNNHVLRIAWLFMVPIVFVLPKSLSQIRDKSLRDIIMAVAGVGFIAFGFYQILFSSWQGAFPYIPFWESL